jgi:hypothetical protein
LVAVFYKSHVTCASARPRIDSIIIYYNTLYKYNINTFIIRLPSRESKTVRSTVLDSLLFYARYAHVRKGIYENRKETLCQIMNRA